MNIAYFNPLDKAWNRMKAILFQPFDIHKWFILGFTVFLADLGEHHGGSGGNNARGRGHVDIEEIFHFPREAWHWLIDNPGWAALIAVGVVFLIGVGIVLTWLSSRGKFMFLDNVVHNRALVKKPWYELQKEGNSLFVWRLIFGFIAIGIFIAFFIFVFSTMTGMYDNYASDASMISAGIGMGLLFLGLILCIGYVELFLSDFVVPIMYKKRISATEGWNTFLPLFSKHFLYFLLYGLFIFFFIMLFVIGIIIAGLFTCCIGFIFLVIPYINSVVLLPISVLFRCFSLEFLSQFGNDFEVLSPLKKLPGAKPAKV